MGLVEDFPENPFVPTLRWAATQLTPLRLACGRNPIKLGSTLSVSYNKDQKSTFSDVSAFSRSSLEQTRVVFTSGSSGSVSQSSTFDAASRQTDMNFSIHGEIGGDLLGAEVQVNYEKHVLDSNSNIGASFASSFTSGKATFAEIPRLSSQAINLLQSAEDPVGAFKNAYGEYYVGAYILGASNINNLGAATKTSASSEGVDGEVKIKVLFVHVSVGFSHHESHFDSMSVATLSAYDTLDGWSANQSVSDAAAYTKVLDTASNNGANSSTIAHRVSERMEKLGLVAGNELPWSMCEDMFRNGVVSEVLLLPYARLREYNEALLAGWARSSSYLQK